ncbi:MAG: zinc-binding alcohol dehydrogenase [bacterium]
MQRKMVVIKSNGTVAVKKAEVPKLKKGQALIKVGVSLISPGTEMANLIPLRKTPDPSLDGIPFGYSNAGEIVEVNDDSDHGLKPGMRVAAMGSNAALHTDYTLIPRNLIIPIPDTLSYDEAVYACLGATSLQAVHRTECQLGEYGAILGGGIVGNLAAQLAQISGSRVILWDAMESRLEIARNCGINNGVSVKKNDASKITKDFANPYGLDFGIIAFGGDGTAAFNQLKTCMKVSQDGHIMGRVTVVGGSNITFLGGAGSGNLNIRSSGRTGPGYHDPEYELGKEYPAAFVQFTTQRNLKEIISLLAEKKLHVAPLTTHKMSIDDCAKAVDLLIDEPDKALGIVLEMGH